MEPYENARNTLHLLKLVTGVEISTRAVNRSGRPGNPVKRSNRTAAAAPNKVAFLLSILIMGFFLSKGKLNYLKLELDSNNFWRSVLKTH